MKTFLNNWAGIGAALAIGAAGILELIDQPTMIALIVVLIVCMPNARGACFARRKA